MDKQISRLMDLYQNESIPADVLGERIEKLYKEKISLSEQLERLSPKKKETDFNIDGVVAILKDINVIWNYASVEQKKNIAKTLINRIVLNDDDVKIEWSFVKHN
ncbi:MAG: hypothetical protein FWD71_07605 [Oscillospiraceae bacterium]|nr:hypothetical protein [Oscillospiraceae bacterium]